MPSELTFWILGIGLELLLLLVVLTRGMFHRLPIFTLTIAFYIVRGTAFFALFGMLTRNVYNELYGVLWVADYGFRILLVGEIAFHVSQRARLSRRASWHAAVGIIAANLLGIGATGLWCHEWLSGRREDLVIAVFTSLLLLWMIIKRVGGAVRRIAEGLAFFQLVLCCANYLLRYSSIHRNASLWTAASRAISLAWVAVTIFWIAAIWVHHKTPLCRSTHA